MKNILKKQILWAIPLAFSLLTSSCSDYLDKLPENTVEVEGIDYTNKSNMYMPVSGVYGQSRNYLAGWSTYGCMIVRGDDVNKGGSPTDQIEYQYASEFQYDRLATFWALNALWSDRYKVVTLVNSALESLENYAQHLTNDSDKRLNTQYVAEVRFFRALAYFHLVNAFGDVPLLLNNQELNVYKSKKEDVKKYIYDELDFCIANLPAIRPNESEHPGAVTKYTAEMLKAKQKMYDNEWADMLIRHCQMLVETKGEFTAVREMRKHFAWYTTGIKHAAALRHEVNQVTKQEQFNEFVERIRTLS